MEFLRKLERKFGKYALRHLTVYMIITYAAGYILQLMQRSTGVNYIGFLTLNPYAILHGQVWRLFSWILMPPGNFDIFTLIMLLFYYQIGTMLEKIWGDFLYNFYIFFGLLMTVVGSFVLYAIYGPLLFQFADMAGAALISTYYVSLSLFLGFAMTFPDQVVLFMFILPIKMKWLALVDVAYLVYAVVRSEPKLFVVILILCSLSGTILYFFLMRKDRFSSKRRQRDFQKSMYGYRQGPGNRTQQRTSRYGAANQQRTGLARHRCTICGRTEITNPELEFRFCSKCNGNYEYCSDHLYTHTHIR